jgi:hypothetical protein
MLARRAFFQDSLMPNPQCLVSSVQPIERVRLKKERLMIDFKWSNSEKTHARKLFDAALAAELAETVAEFKARAAAADSAEVMWNISRYVDTRGRDIEEKYDYRYSQLIMVFARLFREGRIDELSSPGSLTTSAQSSLSSRRCSRQLWQKTVANEYWSINFRLKALFCLGYTAKSQIVDKRDLSAVTPFKLG